MGEPSELFLHQNMSDRHKPNSKAARRFTAFDAPRQIRALRVPDVFNF